MKEMYYVILGHGGGKSMTSILEERLEKGYELYQKHPEKIIVSGRYSYLQEEESEETEAGLMKDYLIKKGVSEQDIITEDQSRETIGNIRFVDKILDKDKEIILVSSDFHEMRIKRLLEKFFTDRNMTFVPVGNNPEQVQREKNIIQDIYEKQYGVLKTKYDLREQTKANLPGYTKDPIHSREFIRKETLAKL